VVSDGNQWRNVVNGGVEGFFEGVSERLMEVQEGLFSVQLCNPLERPAVQLAVLLQVFNSLVVFGVD
jgi:hypothetical protein